MKNVLSVSEIKDLLSKAEVSFRHRECASCECYLGYLTQLQIDSDPDAGQYIQQYLAVQDQIHACLGCDPCPPGILYSNYLRKKSVRSEIDQ